MSRTRSREFKKLALKAGYPSGYGGGMNSTTLFDTGMETISDNNNGRKRPPSSCQHEKIKISPSQGWQIYSANPTFIYGPWEMVTSSMVQSVVSDVFSPFQKGFERYAHDHLKKQVSIVDQFSLLNNLYELPDMGDLLKKYNILKDYILPWKRISRKVPLPNYLDWIFGIAPLLADTRTLVRNIQTIRDRISQLDSIERIVLSQKRSQRISHSKKFDNYTHFSLSGEMSGTLSGEIEVFLPCLSEMEFQLRALLDCIGVHVDPKMVYDAIPFTWLVDWFIPLGNALEKLNDRRWIKVDLDGQAYISTKADVSINVTSQALPEPYWYGWSWHSISPGSASCIRYKRLAIPFGRGTRVKKIDPVIPDIDNQKALILASLVQARELRVPKEAASWLNAERADLRKWAKELYHDTWYHFLPPAKPTLKKYLMKLP